MIRHFPELTDDPDESFGALVDFAQKMGIDSVAIWFKKMPNKKLCAVFKRVIDNPGETSTSLLELYNIIPNLQILGCDSLSNFLDYVISKPAWKIIAIDSSDVVLLSKSLKYLVGLFNITPVPLVTIESIFDYSCRFPVDTNGVPGLFSLLINGPSKFIRESEVIEGIVKSARNLEILQANEKGRIVNATVADGYIGTDEPVKPVQAFTHFCNAIRKETKAGLPDSQKKDTSLVNSKLKEKWLALQEFEGGTIGWIMKAKHDSARYNMEIDMYLEVQTKKTLIKTAAEDQDEDDDEHEDGSDDYDEDEDDDEHGAGGGDRGAGRGPGAGRGGEGGSGKRKRGGGGSSSWSSANDQPLSNRTRSGSNKDKN